MKFIINEEYDTIAKLDNETLEELTYLDVRNVSLEKAKTKKWYQEWYDKGINHREENGQAVCDWKTKYKARVINIDSLEELIQLQEKLGEIIIGNYVNYLEVKKAISLRSL